MTGIAKCPGLSLLCLSRSFGTWAWNEERRQGGCILEELMRYSWDVGTCLGGGHMQRPFLWRSHTHFASRITGQRHFHRFYWEGIAQVPCLHLGAA